MDSSTELLLESHWHQLCSAQRNYATDGYLRIQGLLTSLGSRKLAERVKKLSDRIIRHAQDQAITGYDPDYRTNGNLARCAWTRSVVFCHNLWRDDEHIRALACDPRLAEFVGRLIGVPALRLWHDASICKPQWGRPTVWHLDGPYWSFTPPGGATLWIALDDANLSNGCLVLLPGTHREADSREFKFSGEVDDLFDAYPEWRNREPVAVPCRAGDAILIHPMVAHASQANMTSRDRLAYSIAYMPDNSIFNGKRSSMSSEHFNSLKIGDVIRNGSHNPLLWVDGTNAVLV